MNRRFFLRALGVGSGALFIPDRFLLKAERFLERQFEPYLVDYKRPQHTFAFDDWGTLHMGDPCQGPTDIPTWREYLVDIRSENPETVAEFLEEQWGCDPDQLDDKMPEDVYMDCYWLRNESSSASAYHFLEYLEIGPVVRDPNGEVVGGLTFLDGPCPGNDSLLVQHDGDLTLSCLQWRLSKLGYRCNFVREEEFKYVCNTVP